jgi:carbonic anhydrase
MKVLGANLDWNYGSQGPDEWPFLAQYPQCSGLSQSPIDIDTDSTLLDKELDDIQFNNYNQEINYLLKISSYTGNFKLRNNEISSYNL